MTLSTGINIAIMKCQKKNLLLLLTCAFLMFCLFKFFVLELPDIKLMNKAKLVTVDPWVQKHWLHVKITNDGDYKSKTAKPKIILLWTNFFGTFDYIPPLEKLNCPISNCIVTSNRSYLALSDALIFHMRDINLEDMPHDKQPWQRWILLNHESPPHTPDILRFLEGYFNWTVTYRFDSDILLTPQVKKRKQILNYFPNFAKNKTRMVAWFVSNCQTHSNREGFVKEMQKSIPIDIFGDCGPKVCLPKMSKECYKKISKEYRYYLSFENSLCKDYITEKFYHILDTDMVPVVMGNANYSKVAPPSSYIDALSFKSPRELAHYLITVAKNERKYNNYFSWRKTHEISYKHYACDICKKLHEDTTPSWHKDLHKWWFKEADCKTWVPPISDVHQNSKLHFTGK